MNIIGNKYIIADNKRIDIEALLNISIKNLSVIYRMDERDVLSLYYYILVVIEDKKYSSKILSSKSHFQTH